MWQIAVFCRNERHRLAACLASVVRAIGDRPAKIMVIVNGSTDGSEEIARAATTHLPDLIQVHVLALADKTNAINRFLYDLCDATATMYFALDGYTVLGERSLAALAERIEQSPILNAASGVAVNGRSITKMARRNGTLCGCLFALRPAFVRRMVHRNYRLPVGLYRGDGLLASMVAHDLDAHGEWLHDRLCYVTEATYQIATMSPFRLKDWRRQYHRMVQQMRGRLETAAIKEVIYSVGFDGLPADANTMIRDYLTRHAPPPVAWRDRPFMQLAVRRIVNG